MNAAPEVTRNFLPGSGPWGIRPGMAAAGVTVAKVRLTTVEGAP